MIDSAAKCLVILNRFIAQAARCTSWQVHACLELLDAIKVGQPLAPCQCMRVRFGVPKRRVTFAIFARRARARTPIRGNSERIPYLAKLGISHMQVY